MYLAVVTKRVQRKIDDRELSIEQTRQLMTLIANTNRDPKKKPAPYIPTDFWKLSYDKLDDGEEAPPLTLKEVKEQLGSRLKR